MRARRHNPGGAVDATGGSDSLAQLAARREGRREAARRARRRRRLLLATPILGLLCWAVVSYAIWMLEPTSMRFGARSVEWVRAEVPFGNSLVDKIEHVYYSANAPKKGGPAPKSLPAVGLILPRRRHSSQPGHRRSSRSSPTRCPAKGSGNRPARRSTAAHRCW